MKWSPRQELLQIWSAGLAAVDPLTRVPHFLGPRPPGRLVVVGAGKASARMARAVETHYGAPLEGLVLTRYGHGARLEQLELIEAGHPLPDEQGQAGAERCLALAESLREADRLLLLLSGGGSALLTLPSLGIPLADKQLVNRALLASGARIEEINIVRKHLSRIKGGRLAAAAWPAETVTLAISDVPGDDPSVIASGPSVPDPSTLEEARAIVTRYRIKVPSSVQQALREPANETPKAGHPKLARSTYHLIARPGDMMTAALRTAEALGYAPVCLGDHLEGEARIVGAEHAALATGLLCEDHPTAVISGGELTVTGASGTSFGGRAREYALALAIGLGRTPGVAALAGDTDGIDGTPDAAGAFIFPDTIARAAAAGLSPAPMLSEHRSGEFFSTLKDAHVTGPTGTNAGDLRILLIHPQNPERHPA